MTDRVDVTFETSEALAKEAAEVAVNALDLHASPSSLLRLGVLALPVLALLGFGLGWQSWLAAGLAVLAQSVLHGFKIARMKASMKANLQASLARHQSITLSIDSKAISIQDAIGHRQVPMTALQEVARLSNGSLLSFDFGVLAVPDAALGDLSRDAFRRKMLAWRDAA